MKTTQNRVVILCAFLLWLGIAVSPARQASSENYNVSDAVHKPDTPNPDVIIPTTNEGNGKTLLTVPAVLPEEVSVSPDGAGVFNTDPVFTSSPVISIVENGAYSYNILISNTDLNGLTISATTLPEWLTLNVDSGGVLSDFVGSGQKGSADGTTTGASFDFPEAMAIDAAGNLYISDSGNGTVRHVTPEGVVTTLHDGSVLRWPSGLAIDSQGNVFVSDGFSHSIYKIDADANLTVFAGTGGEGDSNGTGTNASFANPVEMTIDDEDNLFVADFDNYTIRKITKAGVVSVLAGSGRSSFVDGTGASAGFSELAGITLDSNGNLFVTDPMNEAVRMVTPEGVVTTVTNQLDGNIKSISAGPTGTLYVADQSNDKIYEISQDGNISILLNNGLNEPQGVLATADGSIFISDEDRKIKRIPGPKWTLTGTAPAQAGVFNVVLMADDGNQGTNTQVFSITVNDVTDPVFSSVNPSTGFEENSTAVVYTALATDNNPVVYGLGTDKDESLFSIDESTGELTFKSPPDFENPLDIIGRNIYQVEIIANDGTNQADLDLKVHVANVSDEAPVFISSPLTQVDDNQEYEYRIHTQDADGDEVTITSDNLPAWLSIVQDPGGEVKTFAGSGSQVSVDGVGTLASFRSFGGIAIDQSDNIYVSDFLSHTIRKITPDGTVGAFVGSGAEGTADGTGTEASFDGLMGITIDKDGNLYVADRSNNLIRKITPEAVVTTVAGTGRSGTEDGPIATATFNQPSDVAVDAAGDLYVVDSRHKIRKISNGVVATLAGSGSYGYADGTGTEAHFAQPESIVVDGDGNLFVADFANHVIRKVTPEGVVTTLAGSGSGGTKIGYGTEAQFNLPGDIDIDAAGNIFVTDLLNRQLRKVSPDGMVTVLAGSGMSGDVDGFGIEASFNGINGVALDSKGKVFFLDASNYKLKTFEGNGPGPVLTGNPAGQSGMHNVVLQANDCEGGSTMQQFSIDVKDVTAPVFGSSTVMARFTENETGLVYKAEATDTHTITYSLGPNRDESFFDINGATGEITFKTVPDFEEPLGQFGNSYFLEILANDGNNTASQTLIVELLNVSDVNPVFLSNPVTTVDDNQEYQYRLATKDGDGEVVTISSENLPAWLSFEQDRGGEVKTFAGSGSQESVDGVGTLASFRSLGGIAIDHSDNVYVSDYLNNTIRKITPDGTVGIFAGSGAEGTADGTGTSASFDGPNGIAVDSEGNLYVADRSNNLIRKITPGAVVTTVAGSGSLGGQDGEVSTATFYQPTDVAVDAMGDLYVVDFNHKVRKISNGMVSTLAGSGTYGLVDGVGSEAQFAQPESIVVDTNGNLFVADLANHAIRKITSTGEVTTLAGSGTRGTSNGTGTEARFNLPGDIAIDADGNIFVTDLLNRQLRKVTPDGVVTVLAGSGTAGDLNGFGTEVRFDGINGVDLDSKGKVFIVDASNYKIKTFEGDGPALVLKGDPAGQPESNLVTLIASDGNGGTAVQSFTITVNDLTAPVFTSGTSVSYTEKQSKVVYTAIANDANPLTFSLGSAGDESVFIIDPATGDLNFKSIPLFASPEDANQDNNYTVEIHASDGVNSASQTLTVTVVEKVNVAPVFASSPVIEVGDSELYHYAIEMTDGNGDDVIVTATDLPSWLSIEQGVSGEVSSVAGNGSDAYADGTGTDASFSFMLGMAVDALGNVYVADYGNNRIRKIDREG